MCSHYQTLKDAELLLKKFGASKKPAASKYDMWPRYAGVFIRRPVEHDAGDEVVPEREAVVGRWGLISAMTKVDGLDKAGKLSTFNARSETAAKSLTFSNAWRRAQHCIIPADAIFEPDWRSGSAVPTRFTRADGAPLGIAGLWDRYRDAAGQWQESCTMLTINADNDPLFRLYHQPGKEKRMIVILPEGAYGDWLTAPTEAPRDFLVPFPSDKFVATPMERPRFCCNILFFYTAFKQQTMLCTVTRTHCLGEKRPDRDPGPTITGTVRMYSVMRYDLKRYVRVMTMDSLATFGDTKKSPIPDLLQPELLTFASDRGMMVCGFEEIEGKRYYQGWWMQWVSSQG